MVLGDGGSAALAAAEEAALNTDEAAALGAAKADARILFGAVLMGLNGGRALC